MKSLYKTCAGHTLLPRSLHFELHDYQIGTVLSRGGFGDVNAWAGMSRSRFWGHATAAARRKCPRWVTGGPLFPCTCQLTGHDVCRGSARRLLLNSEVRLIDHACAFRPHICRGAVRAAEYTHVTVGHRSVTWERYLCVYIPHRCVGIRSNSSSSLLSSSLSNSLTLR